ncbi:MAG: M28 family peptidase [Tannerella sp.]|jgi:Zn-dependent M28 family amino/carboxypeptidase|nr:M28 family peptidase [Tannerella sp.]
MNRIVYLFTGCLFLFCCGQKTATETTTTTAFVTKEKPSSTPSFDADSAYSYIERQVLFGPRVPNSQAHKSCAAYLVSELTRHGARIYVQEAMLKAYNQTNLQASNIIGAFYPEKTQRVLLFAHWDTRPYADQDTKDNHYKPIDGADDGASGVGVLLEIARHLGTLAPEKGIDIIFFDAEDYGTPDFATDYSPDSWCLGAQFWAKNPHVPNYRADYGILLDMVGAKGATFYKESTSVYRAAPIVEKVWNAARNLGYGRYFINANGGGVTDDHQYVIRERGIPCIDIIHLNPDTKHGFGNHWHTLGDAMDIIDRETLKAVGQTLLEVIYKK